MVAPLIALLIPILPGLILWGSIGLSSAFAIISAAKILAIGISVLVALFGLRFVLSGGRR